MSLTLTPYGLSLVEYKGGKNTFSTSTYLLASGTSTSIGQGDPVMSGINGYVTAYEVCPVPSPNYPSPRYSILGQALSFSWISTTGVAMNNQPYWPGGTLTLNSAPAIITVADLFSNVYKIQCNGSLSLTSPATATFYNYNMTETAPNARTSQSETLLDTSSAGTSAGNYWFALKIVGLAPTAMDGGPNTWYDPYPEVLVMINNHPFKYGTNGTNATI